MSEIIIKGHLAGGNHLQNLSTVTVLFLSVSGVI